jgi:hypothetical protein
VCTFLSIALVHQSQVLSNLGFESRMEALVDYEMNSPVHPGLRVGPFRLGMSLYEALNVIKMRNMKDVHTEKTEILFSRTSPPRSPSSLMCNHSVLD